jgi:hypothetical protein
VRLGVGLVMCVVGTKTQFNDGAEFLKGVERVVDGGTADVGVSNRQRLEDLVGRRVTIGAGQITTDCTPLRRKSQSCLLQGAQEMLEFGGVVGHTIAYQVGYLLLPAIARLKRPLRTDDCDKTERNLE